MIPTLGEIVLPGFLIGIPALALLLVIAGQFGAAAAWLPIVRRWLNRPVLPDRTAPVSDPAAHAGSPES